jgi:hypothetical protein
MDDIDMIFQSERSTIIEATVDRVCGMGLPRETVGQGVEAFTQLIATIGERRRSCRCDVVAIAGRHGEQRSRNGYDLRMLLRELEILRVTIVDVMTFHTLSVGSLEQINTLIHAGMIEAAVLHADHRKRVASLR